MDLVKNVLSFLALELPRLILSGQGWSIEIHGKGSSIKVKVAGTTQFRGEDKLLE